MSSAENSLASKPLGPVTPPRPPRSKSQRRHEKRKLRLRDSQHLLYTKHFSNYRLTQLEQSPPLNQQVRLIPSSRMMTSARCRNAGQTERRSSPWSRLGQVQCPCAECSHMVDPPSWLDHYLDVHQHCLHVPFVELVQPLRDHAFYARCNVADLVPDEHTLLGVYGYRRQGVNPLSCARNTYLPMRYKQYSQHGVLLLFACRTNHSPLWRRNHMDEVLTIWAVTPLQGVCIGLRTVVQSIQAPHYYAKCIKARPFPPQMPPCREFIKTDGNVILIRLADVRQSLEAAKQQMIVQLHVTGEQKI